jgi:hypothetical protein
MKNSPVSNSANQQVSNIFADKANLVSNSANLFFVSKLCKQFYPVSKFTCRCQQHDYSAGISISTLARQSTESISFPAGAFLFLIYDSLRIAGPSWKVRQNKWNRDRSENARRSKAKTFPTRNRLARNGICRCERHVHDVCRDIC